MFSNNCCWNLRLKVPGSGFYDEVEGFVGNSNSTIIPTFFFLWLWVQLCCITPNNYSSRTKFSPANSNTTTSIVTTTNPTARITKSRPETSFRLVPFHSIVLPLIVCCYFNWLSRTVCQLRLGIHVTTDGTANLNLYALFLLSILYS